MTKQMLLGDCFEVERNISRVGKTVKKSEKSRIGLTPSRLFLIAPLEM